MDAIPASKKQKAAIAIRRGERYKPKAVLTWPKFEEFLQTAVGKRHISELTDDEARYVLELMS
jgi:hypothetical protein